MFSEVIALDFDFACTTRLMFYDAEKENRHLEAMAVGAMSGMFGAKPSQKTPAQMPKKTMAEGSF